MKRLSGHPKLGAPSLGSGPVCDLCGGPAAGVEANPLRVCASCTVQAAAQAELARQDQVAAAARAENTVLTAFEAAISATVAGVERRLAEHVGDDAEKTASLTSREKCALAIAANVPFEMLDSGAVRTAECQVFVRDGKVHVIQEGPR